MKPQFSSVPMSLYKFLEKQKDSLPDKWHSSSSDYLMVHLKNTIRVSKHFEMPERELNDDLLMRLHREAIYGRPLELPFPGTTISRVIGGQRAFIVVWDDAFMDAVRESCNVADKTPIPPAIYVHTFLMNNYGQWLPLPGTVRIAKEDFLLGGAHPTGFNYKIAWVDKNFEREFTVNAANSPDVNLCSYYVRDVFELCAHLSANTAKVEVLKDSSTRTKMSNAKKLPKSFYEIRRVIIEAPKTTTSEYKGGTHASPRWHERRGYWRTMKKSGKVIWVRACEVGKKSNGMVYKDYEIKIGETK